MPDTLTLPNPDQAHTTLFNRVWSEAFFSKLASYGIVPNSPQEGQTLIDLAGRIAVADAAEGVKAAQTNKFASALEDLDTVLADRGYGESKASAQQFAVKTAAALMQDPEIFLSTLSLVNAAAAAEAK